MHDEFKRLPNEFKQLEKISISILDKIAKLLKDELLNIDSKDSVYIVSRALKVLLQAHIDSIIDAHPENEFVSKQTILYIIYPSLQKIGLKGMKINETELH